jgi:sigma-E factor negative regulatory protein RseB
MHSAMKQSGVFLSVLILLGSVSATADVLPSEETEWLKTWVTAAKKTDFSGVFVHQSGEYVGMSKVVHVSDKDGEHERLEELDGGKRVLIRRNDQVWLFADGHRIKLDKRRIRPSFPALLPEQLSSLQENYTVRREEDEVIAGFHAHSLIFQPRDNLRYSRKMWAHDDTGLLLKMVVLDDRGSIIEQYAFMQLKISGNIERDWILREKTVREEVGAQVQTPHPHIIELLETPCGWQVDAIPAGFKKIQEMRRTFRVDSEPVIHLVYSDGLAGISVFIEKMNGTPHFQIGLARMGAVNVYSRLVGDSLVTVVGGVPARTVIQISDSVRYAGQQ